MVAVLLYHANLPWIPGGYVGIDVLFGISGFLITTHLLTQIQRNGRVSFAGFYAKRVRRILPAAFTVLAISVIAAFFLYPPLLMSQELVDIPLSPVLREHLGAYLRKLTETNRDRSALTLGAPSPLVGSPPFHQICRRQ